MRFDRLVTLAVGVVLIGLALAATARPAPPPPTATKAPEVTGPLGLPLGLVEWAEWGVRVAVLIFFMVVAWRAMRALESVAASARRPSGEPGPRPTDGDPPPAG